MAERFPPPWTVHWNDNCCWVEDALGQRFGYCYFETQQTIGTGRRSILSRDGARRIASNIAKLPELIASSRTKSLRLEQTDGSRVPRKDAS